jgi:regulator of RNase E activity RraB
MGFLSRIFRKKEVGPYRTEEQRTTNRDNQLKMTPQTLDALRQHRVDKDSLLRLEFFFYTNTSEKAAKLSDNLASLGYSSDFGTSAGNAKEYIINGWSTPIKMDESTVLEWSALMCELAANHDCEFDGWGTDPTQASRENDDEAV